MAIEITVSSGFRSSFRDNINVFECRLCAVLQVTLVSFSMSFDIYKYNFNMTTQWKDKKQCSCENVTLHKDNASKLST